MSERKTDEIKFRVEPSVKARWQAAADREGIGLSEFMRQAAERESNPIIVLKHPEGSAPFGGQFLTGVTAFTPNDGEPLAKPETEHPEESQTEQDAVLSAPAWKPFGADSFA